MKIALISPRSSFLGRNTAFKNFFAQSPTMEFYRRYWSGLGSGLLIIGALTPKGIELELIDENVEEIDFSKSYNLVAITAMTQQAIRAYNIAKVFREKNIPVVLGGIHATVLPDEAKLYADSIVAGEVENVWQTLLDDLNHNRLKLIYDSHYEVDLKESPVPKYELLREKPYKIIWIQATRGCPHDCSFCSSSKVYGFKYRHKTVNQVIEEIEKIRKIKKHALIGFADDNLFCNKEYSCQLLEKVSNLKIRWIGQSDISIAYNRSLLKLIKKSGCVALLIGFESIIEDNLRGIDSSNWKIKHLKNYGENIRVIQDNGIGIIGTFIVGFDHDDKSVFEKLANFITINHLVGAQIAALTPFPNTRVREVLLSENRILDTPWENYTLYDVNIKPKKMSPQELEEGILNTFKKVYSSSVAIKKAKYFKDVFTKIRKESI